MVFKKVNKFDQSRHSVIPSGILFHQAEHERVWDWQCFTQEQLRVLAHQWQRDHWELLARGLVTLEEARNAHYEEMEFRKDRQHQQDICSHLREKVCVS